MEAIYSLTTLQRNPTSVKEKAKHNLVHLTENGNAAYVFCTEEYLDELIRKERADAVFEARLMDSIAKGKADIDAGDSVEDLDDAFAKADQLRKSYA